MSSILARFGRDSGCARLSETEQKVPAHGEARAQCTYARMVETNDGAGAGAGGSRSRIGSQQRWQSLLYSFLLLPTPHRPAVQHTLAITPTAPATPGHLPSLESQIPRIQLRRSSRTASPTIVEFAPPSPSVPCDADTDADIDATGTGPRNPIPAQPTSLRDDSPSSYAITSRYTVRLYGRIVGSRRRSCRVWQQHRDLTVSCSLRVY